MKAKSFKDLAEVAQKRGGITKTTMWKLRELAGHGKLSNGIVKKIEAALRGVGLAPLDTLVPDQNVQVRIYIIDSPPGEVIEATRTKGAKSTQTLKDAGLALAAARAMREQLEN